MVWYTGTDEGKDMIIKNLDGEIIFEGESFVGANLINANLSYLDLRGKDFSNACLIGADLRFAYLLDSCFYNANLSNANLSRSFLARAEFSGANLEGAKLPKFQIPDGDIVGWKKAYGKHREPVLVKLIVKGRRTSSLVGRKCRCEYAYVEGIFEYTCGIWSPYDGDAISEGGEKRDRRTIYKKGEYVYPDKYDDDIRIECTHGIHFFLTREEAEDY